MTELSLLIVTPYLDEEKPMPGEDGMSDLPLIGETQYLPDDKGDGLVAQEYESKNENYSEGSWYSWYQCRWSGLPSYASSLHRHRVTPRNNKSW